MNSDLSSQNLNLNRVTLATADDEPPPSPSSSSPQQQTYDLLHSDKFWEQHRGRYYVILCNIALLHVVCFSPFPAMADAVQAEVDRYKTSEEEMKSLKSAMVGSLSSISLYCVPPGGCVTGCG